MKVDSLNHHSNFPHQEYIDGCRAASAPIRLLAPEILCEIFGYIANPTPSIYISSPVGTLGRLAKQDLLQLSQVCTLWHDLIMGTPALWSEIGIIGIYWSGEHLKVLKACLERAKDCLLTMTLNLFDIHSEHLQPLMELLVHHCHRWLHLSLVIDPSRVGILQAFKGRLHSLQEISLTLHSWTEGGLASIDVFEDAPRLTQVHFATSPWISGLPRLPWGQLCSFTCADTGTYGFLDVMRNLSALNATFTLRNFHPYGDPPHLPPITSHISSFSLEM